MRTLADGHQGHEDAVRHVEEAPAAGAPTPRRLAGACARCGAPAASRPGVRYCGARCRLGATRERRATARADLLAALAQAQDATTRISRALAALGLNPARPRRRREPPCPPKT